MKISQYNSRKRDIYRPCEINETSLGGAKYFVTLREEASDCVRAKPIAKKSETSDYRLKHVKRVER